MRPNVTFNDELKTVIIENDEKRYEVYFDKDQYTIFIGQPGDGSLIEVDRRGKIEYIPNW
jgi:hypothetical protein